MTRSELYARVWQTPMSKLGPELGLSDQGLAKGCRRHGIPVPPAGYWARVAAGQSPARLPMPNPEDDSDVFFLRAHIDERRIALRDMKTQLAKANKAERLAMELPVVEMRPTLEEAHPLVKATARFFANIQRAIEESEQARSRPAAAVWRPNELRAPPTTYGRYASGGPGRLAVAATPRHIDWILRFHDALLRGLIGQQCTIRSQAPDGPQRVAVLLEGERVHLSFAEEFDKLARKPPYPPKYTPRDTFKVNIERAIGGPKHWAGTAPMLESQLGAIVRDVVAMLRAQARHRVTRAATMTTLRLREERAAAEREAIEAAQEAARKRAAACEMQLERAKRAAADLDEHESLKRLLVALETRITAGPEQQSLRSWLSVVRSQLVDPLSELIGAIRVERDVGGGVPMWWPDN